jgi:hypothetical protein
VAARHSGLVIMLHLKVDQVIIKHLLNTEAVGYYAAALRLSESTYFVPVVICTSLLPPMLNARSKSVGLYRTRLQQLFNLMVLLSLGIALPVTFLGDWIIDLVFGKAYHPAGAVLVLHIWSGVFVALGVAANGWLIAENLHRIALYRTLLGVVINIGLNFALIPSSASRVRPWQPSSPRPQPLTSATCFPPKRGCCFSCKPGRCSAFRYSGGPGCFSPRAPMTRTDPEAPLRTAVLLVLFNRPEATRTVFEAIRRARPPRLLPGGRRSPARPPRRRSQLPGSPPRGECRRLALRGKYLLPRAQPGLRTGTGRGVRLVLRQEEEGIVLEDDCVPDPSFFPFCQELLDEVPARPAGDAHYGTNFLGIDTSRRIPTTFPFTRTSGAGQAGAGPGNCYDFGISVSRKWPGRGHCGPGTVAGSNTPTE